MSRLSRLLRRDPPALSGHPEDLWRELIARFAPGRTFVDVGCMWNVDGDYAFHALRCGATAVTGIDVDPASAAFHARNAEVGNRVRFLQADLNEPDLTRLGRHDVVFCSGVLYHVPDPIHSLEQLRTLCRETLILTSVTTAERVEPNTAILLPYLDDAVREKLTYLTRLCGTKMGLDTPFDPQRGYANWFWLPTPSCVTSMVKLAGFDVVESYVHRRVTTIVGRVA